MVGVEPNEKKWPSFEVMIASLGARECVRELWFAWGSFVAFLYSSFFLLLPLYFQIHAVYLFIYILFLFRVSLFGWRYSFLFFFGCKCLLIVRFWSWKIYSLQVYKYLRKTKKKITAFFFLMYFVFFLFLDRDIVLNVKLILTSLKDVMQMTNKVLKFSLKIKTNA